MKTFSELFLELLEAVAAKRKPFDSVAFDAKQKAKYGSSMAKAAADALAAAQRKKAAAATPSKKTLPWATSPKMFPAWWHPTKEALLFNINNDGYHITKLVKYPEKFGIYSSDLMIAAEQDAEDYSGNWGRKVSANEVLKDIRTGDIDNATAIMGLAYSNGWLRVYGGKFHTGEVGGTLEGMDKKSIKAAITEIEQAAEMAGIENIRIDVTEKGRAFKFTKLDTKEKRDAYMKG